MAIWRSGYNYATWTACALVDPLPPPGLRKPDEDLLASTDWRTARTPDAADVRAPIFAPNGGNRVLQIGVSPEAEAPDLPSTASCAGIAPVSSVQLPPPPPPPRADAVLAPSNELFNNVLFKKQAKRYSLDFPNELSDRAQQRGATSRGTASALCSTSSSYSTGGWPARRRTSLRRATDDGTNTSDGDDEDDYKEDSESSGGTLHKHYKLEYKYVPAQHAGVVLYDKSLPLKNMMKLKWNNPPTAPCILIDELNEECEGYARRQSLKSPLNCEVCDAEHMVLWLCDACRGFFCQTCRT